MIEKVLSEVGKQNRGGEERGEIFILVEPDCALLSTLLVAFTLGFISFIIILLSDDEADVNFSQGS